MKAMRDLLAAVQSGIRAQRDHPRPSGLRYALWVATVVVLTVVAEALLLAFAPRAIGWSTFIVYGSSMEPAILQGSVAVARPVSPESLKVGDIVAYRTPGSSGLPTLHRILEVHPGPTSSSFTIKGDANSSPDPFVVNLEGTGSKVVYGVPVIGRVANFAHTPAGHSALVQVPLAVLGILILLEIWMPGRASLLFKWP